MKCPTKVVETSYPCHWFFIYMSFHNVYRKIHTSTQQKTVTVVVMHSMPMMKQTSQKVIIMLVL